MSDVEESKAKQVSDTGEVPAEDDATFFKHDGIETFAELKERLKVKTGTDGG